MITIRSAAAAIAIAAAAASLAACGPSHASGLSASHSAEASAAAHAYAGLSAKCVPQSSAAQLKLASSLKSKSGRKALDDKCGVPPQNKAAFEADVLSAVEHGHLTRSKADRTVFFTVTLPRIIQENQG